MELRWKRIPISRIDWNDTTFAIHAFRDNPHFRQSLESVGVLTPPILWEKDGGSLAVVDGLKRLRWLQNHHTSFDALVYPSSAELKQLMVHRLETKMFSAPLNLAEKAQIVAKYTPFTTESELKRRILPALGLSSRNEAPSLWERIGNWPAAHLKLLAHDLLSERAALYLAQWEPADRDQAMRLFDTLRCSASIQMEILERTSDIARRDGISPCEMLAHPELQRILHAQDLNRREKTQEVRDLIHRRRFPRLSAKEKRLRQRIEDASLPSNVSLVPPPHFEGETWEVRIRFKTPEELTATMHETARRCSTPPVQDIFREFQAFS